MRTLLRLVLLLSLLLVQAACIDTSAPPSPTPEPATATPVPPTAAPPAATVTRPAPTSTATSVPTTVPTAVPTVSPTSRPIYTPVAKKPSPPAEGSAARVLVSGSAATRCVALTFDMGEKAAGGTPAVLDALKKEGAQATFFLTGQWAEANPELVRRMVAEGHELGNHSYDHPDFTTVGEAEMLSQLDRTEAIVQKITPAGLRPYFRPPFGAYNDKVRAAVAKRGYHILYWTLDSADWRNEMEVGDVVTRVVGKTNPGDIVVFHGYTEKTAAAMLQVLPQLKAKGYCLRTLSEVLP